MLEFLRRGVKSWVAKALLLLLIASFAVWGISDVFTHSPSSAVATIGDETVTFEAYANELQRRRNVLSQQAGRAVSFAEMRANGIDQLILGQMMRERAMAAELAALGLSVPDEAVAEAIRAIPAFQSSAGGFSPDSYRFALQREGFSPAAFEELTRVGLSEQLLTGAVSAGAMPPPGLAPRIAAYQGERRAIDTAILPPERAPDPGEPDDAELEAHYAANPEAYTDPERRSGLYIEVSAALLAEELAPSDDEIAAWYAENGNLLGVPASRTVDQLPVPRGRAQSLATRLRDGEITFEAAARELGEDPADLDLGRVEATDLPDRVAEAVFAASEPGIVGPVDAPTGAVLIRIRDVTIGGTPSLEAARDDIAARLARQAALDRAPEIANEIDDLRAAGRSLETVASETGLALGRFEGLTADGRLEDGRAEGILARPDFLAEVFEALDHEERDLHETPEGGYFLVLVERIEEAHLEPLDAVRDRVAADWAAEARQAALLAEAERVAGAIAGEADLAGWAEREGLRLVSHPAFGRDRPPMGLPVALVEAVFAAEEGTGVAARLPGQAGAIVVEVRAVEGLEPDALGDLSGRVEAAMAAQLAGDQAELFARAVEASFTAEVDPGALQAVFDYLGARTGG